MFVSILAQRRAMAPPERRERALTSVGWKPRLGPMSAADARSASVMLLERSGVGLLCW